MKQQANKLERGRGQRVETGSGEFPKFLSPVRKGISEDGFLGRLRDGSSTNFFNMSSFPFSPLYIHTYINSLVGFYLKHEELVNKHDTKDSS